MSTRHLYRKCSQPLFDVAAALMLAGIAGLAMLFVAGVYVLLFMAKAHGQDGSWVDRLQNQQLNVCCFDNDGRRLDNPDWDTLGKVNTDYNGMSGYRVYEDGEWKEIPNWAVVIQRNQDGIARVWWDREFRDDKVYKKARCFLPGAVG